MGIAPIPSTAINPSSPTSPVATAGRHRGGDRDHADGQAGREDGRDLRRLVRRHDPQHPGQHHAEVGQPEHDLRRVVVGHRLVRLHGREPDHRAEGRAADQRGRRGLQQRPDGDEVRVDGQQPAGDRLPDPLGDQRVLPYRVDVLGEPGAVEHLAFTDPASSPSASSTAPSTASATGALALTGGRPSRPATT
jgi:hypothetical protein